MKVFRLDPSVIDYSKCPHDFMPIAIPDDCTHISVRAPGIIGQDEWEDPKPRNMNTKVYLVANPKSIERQIANPGEILQGPPADYQPHKLEEVATGSNCPEFWSPKSGPGLYQAEIH